MVWVILWLGVRCVYLLTKCAINNNYNYSNVSRVRIWIIGGREDDWISQCDVACETQSIQDRTIPGSATDLASAEGEGHGHSYYSPLVGKHINSCTSAFTASSSRIHFLKLVYQKARHWPWWECLSLLLWLWCFKFWFPQRSRSISWLRLHCSRGLIFSKNGLQTYLQSNYECLSASSYRYIIKLAS